MPPRPRPIGPVLPRAIARARAAERRAFDVEARAQRVAAAAFNHCILIYAHMAGMGQFALFSGG